MRTDPIDVIAQTIRVSPIFKGVNAGRAAEVIFAGLVQEGLVVLPREREPFCGRCSGTGETCASYMGAVTDQCRQTHPQAIMACLFCTARQCDDCGHLVLDGEGRKRESGWIHDTCAASRVGATP